MRSSIVAVCLVLAATPAQPEPTAGASKEIPQQCRAIAKQAESPITSTAQSAKISLANCLADVRLAPLKLIDCEESMLEVDAAVKQSFEILDGVMAATTEDLTRVIGEQAKAELYNQMITRMRTTLPPAGTTESSIALHEARKAILEQLMARWRDEAAKSYEHIVAIVKTTPKLEKNPVVAAALRTAKDRLRLHVAKRDEPPAEKPAESRDAIITDEQELR